jgi:Protein of unknown function (DUF1553)/Protein of unknown function (DUF1549)/Planctomycete cytochrome C
MPHFRQGVFGRTVGLMESGRESPRPPRSGTRAAVAWAARLGFVAALVGVAFAVTKLADDVGRPQVATVDFDREIRPVLAGTCLRCHGGVRELAGLHLGDPVRATSPIRRDRGRGARAETTAIVPGNPEASELMRRITADESERMPPDGEPLTPEQVEHFRRWIAEGAEWKELWSVRPLQPLGPPRVKGSAWVRSPLDSLVLAGLERAGLGPSPTADRSTLLRRLSLDIIGLPPTVAELDAFLADDAPGAYERAVDRLLASPQFGERWARPWLDIARYADTQGYEKDGRRTIWAYRDWVIHALNADMPYDRFVTTQLAGDLLPNATDDDRIATAFHRNTLTNSEGGTDNEEFRMAAVFDRVAVTWTGLLGTTMHCAQCHSHTYDAFTQEEYYQFVAFLNQTADADRDDEFPTITVQSPGFRERDSATTTVPVLQELPAEARRVTHVLERGSLKKPKHEVTPDTPACMPPFPADAPRNRLGLARWLTSPENALFARVGANRIWETLFGRGIVETVEDFGSQGAWPSDPALIDHIARRYIELGFSTKALIREIVLSATYRQSSTPSPEALERDPDNRLWSRAPRYRLEAEAVRDSILAVSGLLSAKMYGPSVMPPQPEGVWSIVYSDDRWTVSEGEDRYRRAIYTFWRRTSPHPALIAFDAPSRETCTPRRGRSNSPLAALVGLNDPVMVEAARGLAKRVVTTDSADTTLSSDAERVGRMVRIALVREARPNEIDTLLSLFASERDRLTRDRDATKSLAGVDDPRLAAWTSVASAILNLDEFLTRG